MDKKKLKKIKQIIIVLFIICGSGISFTLKYLFLKDFYFPYFQIFLMFIGEFLIAPVYFIESLQRKPKKSQSSSQPALEKHLKLKKLLIFSLISIFDGTNAFLEDMCLNSMNASDFLSLKMTINYYILLYRVGVIKRKMYRHQYLGIFIFSLGILCFVLSNALTADSEARKELGISIGLMFLAEFFGALHLLFIEYFAWKLDSSAAEVLSIKSSAGLILCGILYYPLTKMTEKNNETYSLSLPFRILYSNLNFSIIVTALAALIGAYNYIFVYLLKFTESLAVCTVDSGRIVIVSVIVAISGSTNLIAVQIIAALCIFLGLSVYNEILVLPFCGLKQSAKASLKENKMIRRKREEERMWIHRLVFFAENQNKASDFTLND